MRLRQLDADLKQELACHQAMKQADRQRSGVPASEAVYVSRRALGNATLAREDARAIWISRWLDDLCRDVGYAVRMLRKGPAFTMVVILTLAVGIGANSAVFTLANAMLLRGLPFDRPDRIMYIDTRDAR